MVLRLSFLPFFLLLLAWTILQAVQKASSKPLGRADANITTLSASEISSFKPYSFYANTAYCQPPQTLLWACGQSCDANPTFRPIASGGDGIDIQFWYVGFDPTLQTVIVAHQGTDPSEIVPLLIDADFFLVGLNPTLFPGVPSNIQVHSGFASEHAKTAVSVLTAVRIALQESGLNNVTVVGHSLGLSLSSIIDVIFLPLLIEPQGAALALLDSIYLPLFLPSVSFKMIGYGMPRVGNQNFASYVDGHIDVTHINNKEDFVPTLPGRVLGFHHPQGEKHIQDDLSWVSCPGDDNTDIRCTAGDVPYFFEGSLNDHDGPYDGVMMGCIQ
ncbi:unnamed protein product [Cyclocybe aegerita]|uniref:Fungal lipase-type domain-containing protein n=1 Tax=Cyclocybe aegerita TaxID=1973307 RepID=A0A8S0X2J9_CYCAE|nr:unnamed protein product [Cyclocybe aegerita]